MNEPSADMKLLETILDIGVAFLQNGAETWRTEDSLYRIAAGYGFTKCNFWVVPSNIQGTVTGPDGNCMTQIRHIKGTGIDFARLEDLNALSRYVCSSVAFFSLFADATKTNIARPTLTILNRRPIIFHH